MLVRAPRSHPFPAAMPSQSSNKIASTFRRGSSTSDLARPDGESSKRPPMLESRRSSLIANLSLRLTTSKRSQSTSMTVKEQEYDRLGELFFAMPNEVQSQVLCHLDLEDIFVLRRTSKSTLSVVDACAASISRAIVSNISSPSDSRYILSIYPMPWPCRSSSYLLQMLHRHWSVTRMIRVIINFIQMKIYMIKTGPRVEHFTKYRNRLATVFYPGAWTIHHFLETYRNLLIYKHLQHDQPRFWDCSECNAAVTDLVNSYPAEHLLPAYQFFALTMLHLRASCRAPSYAGTIERKVRGWSRRPPTDDELAQLIVLGGIEQLSRISVMKGTYNSRLEIIKTFLQNLASGATTVRLVYGSDGTKRAIKDASHFMDEVDVPFDDVSGEVMDSIPTLENVLEPEIARRIQEEDLVEEEEDLHSPFKFVQDIMVGEGGTWDGWQYRLFSDYNP